MERLYMKIERQVVINKNIIISFVLAIFAYLIDETLGNIALLITVGLLIIYRDPSRTIKREDTEILSICDGRVDTIDNHDNKIDIYFKVDMCNTHILRAPIDGKINIINQVHGLNLNPNSYKASILNSSIDLELANLKINFLSGLCNNTIDIASGDVVKGDKIGMFLDGVIKITLDKNDIKLNINIGNKVKAGQTVIAFKK